MGKVTIAKGSPQKRTKRNQSSSSKVSKAAKLSDAKVESTRRRIIGNKPCPIVRCFARSWQHYIRQDVSKLHCDQCAQRGDDVPTDWPEGAFFAEDMSNWRLNKTLEMRSVQTGGRGDYNGSAYSSMPEM